MKTRDQRLKEKVLEMDDKRVRLKSYIEGLENAEIIEVDKEGNVISHSTTRGKNKNDTQI